MNEMEKWYGIKDEDIRNIIRDFVEIEGFKNVEDWTEYYYQKYLSLDIHKRVRFWWFMDEYNLDSSFTRINMIE